MPYIKINNRERFVNLPLSELGKSDINVGELNFILSTVINNYLQTKSVNYNNLNEVIGVLECCKQELYRRIVAPYENIKIIENGDVYSNITTYISNQQ